MAILGRMRDPRAVAPLIDRLKNDKSKDVRIAAATALGMIGDPAAAVYLERAVIYDHRQDVRDASSMALAKLPRNAPPVQQAGATVTQATAGNFGVPVQTNQVPPLQPQPNENVPPPPTPASSSPR